MKAFYLPFEVRPGEFRHLMRNLSRLQLDGFNITVPYKGTVIPYLDELTPSAREIQAVNTVFRRGRKWVGANTDWEGFLLSLREEGRFNPTGKKALVLGAGGAARAATYALAKAGCREIWIANRGRFRSRREKIVRDFQKLFRRVSFVSMDLRARNLKKGLEDVNLVVNATSVGVLYGEVLIPGSLIPRARSGKQILFFDLIYHKPTPFLKIARRKGHRTLGGAGMLVYQGAGAFRLWTGRRAPIQVMRSELKKALRQK